MNKMDIYCITNKRVEFLENFSYKLSWVGDQNVPNNYLRCDNKKNIFFKSTTAKRITENGRRCYLFRKLLLLNYFTLKNFDQFER